MQIKNVNGFTTITANDWKVSVPTIFIEQIVQALTFAVNVPQQVAAEKQRRGRKPAVAVKPVTKVEAVEAAAPAEGPKKRGRKPLSVEQKAASVAASADRPKMAEILKSLTANGKVTRDQLGEQLVGVGHPKGAVAAFVATLDRAGKFGKDGVFAELS